jgi:hypothetical protein
MGGLVSTNVYRGFGTVPMIMATALANIEYPVILLFS